jgi:serine phosphatase RsbU (regulator of sigma subunit)
MGSPPLGRLVDPGRLRTLLDAVAAATPGLVIRLVDASGATVAATDGGGGTLEAKDPAGLAHRRLAVGDEVLGAVEAWRPDGPDESAQASAEAVGQAVGLILEEALSRRAIAAAAIDDLRELALLSRLSATLATTADPGDVARQVLQGVSRPLRPLAGLVLAADGSTVLASAGPEPAVAELLAGSGPLVARLRAEDPIVGSCAEITPDDGPRGGSPGGVAPTVGGRLAAILRTSRGEHGSIVLARPAGSAGFDDADRQLLASVATQAAVALERASLQRVVVDRRALDQELAIGRRIQISLMPRRFPAIDGWQVASAYEPAREVGGDFYDVFRLRDRSDCIGLVVGDVTGKGIPAAILMADTRGLIHAAADHGDDPADTLARVNRILVGERASGLFVTVAHARLDTRTGRLVLARAGHDPVHVLRADGRLEILDPPGRLIGMVDDIAAASCELLLEPGDTFIAHTDGVTDTRSVAGAFYGEERYRALLASLVGRSAQDIVAIVDADVAAFRGLAEPADDLTLLVVRREFAGPEPSVEIRAIPG